MAKKGNNLTDLRKHNLKVILNLLKNRNKNYCCSELAKSIGLCNSGTLKILDYLAGEGIIQVAETVGKKPVGRAPIFYTLNKDFGYLLCVDLTGSLYRILDMKLNVIVSDKFMDISFSEQQGHLYTEEIFLAIVDRIKKSLNKLNISAETILAVCVATFGKVNTETGEFIKVYSVKNYEKINLKTLFQGCFKNAAVLVDNDTNIAVIAESISGKLSDDKINSLFVNVGEGISDAMFVEGKLITCGYGGIGGEIGYSTGYSHYFGKPVRLGDILTIYSVRQNIERELERGAKSEYYNSPISFDEIYSAYDNGDPLTTEIIMDAADVLGQVILNLVNIIDCSKTVISGNALRFGDRFLEKVRSNGNAIRSCLNVEFSSITEDIVIKGAQFLALDMVLDNFAEKGNKNVKVS